MRPSGDKPADMASTWNANSGPYLSDRQVEWLVKMNITQASPKIDWQLRQGASAICTLTKDGKFSADWTAIVLLKDKFLAGDYAPEDAHCVAVAAALWFARNT